MNTRHTRNTPRALAALLTLLAIVTAAMAAAHASAQPGSDGDAFTPSRTSKIYTQLGAGSYSTRARADEARAAMMRSALGRVRSGELVQINMGWSNPARIFRRTAEEILEHLPDHAYRTEPHSTEIDGQAVNTPAFPAVASNAYSKVHPDEVMGAYIDYEPFDTTDKFRFELGFRPSTVAEIRLMAACYATARSAGFTYTNRGLPISCWNTPFRVMDERNDWDAIVQTHAAMGSDYLIINGYQTHNDPIRNYALIAASVERCRDEFESRGRPIRVVVALSLSTEPGRFAAIPTASLIYKAMGARSVDADVLLWLNTDWYTGDGVAAIEQRFEALGGVFR